jgi:tetratricopeptide (TPR) repeat protein
MRMGDHAGVVALLAPREKELEQDRLYLYLMGHALILRNELLRGQGYIDKLFKSGGQGEAQLLMGAAHLARDDRAAAASELEKAAELNPELPGVHSLLGRALMGVSRRDEAGKAFRRELEKNPNDFDANLYLGLLLKEENQLDQAHEHLKRAQRLRSQDAGVLYLLGALHLAAGRVDEAQAALESVTTRVPGYRQAHVLLATVYYRQKNKPAGDRHRAIAEKLAAQEQAKEPGADDELGPAYRGEVTPKGVGPGAGPGDSL